MPATDTFSNNSAGLDAPARNAASVTPSDSADLPNVTRGVWVGSAGDLTVVMKGGQSVTYPSVPAGTLMPICVSRIKSTGTGAGGLVAMWQLPVFVAAFLAMLGIGIAISPTKLSRSSGGGGPPPPPTGVPTFYILGF